MGKARFSSDLASSIDELRVSFLGHSKCGATERARLHGHWRAAIGLVRSIIEGPCQIVCLSAVRSDPVDLLQGVGDIRHLVPRMS